MCDILLDTEQEAKQLTGSILMSKEVQLQIEYMGTCKTKITIYGEPVDISDDRMGLCSSNMAKLRTLVT